MAARRFLFSFPPSPVKVLCWFTIVALLLCAPTGCSTPPRRAHERSAAFHRLSVPDQQLILHGKIRVGMNRDAVYIAWGQPDVRAEGGKGQEATEKWFYERRLTITEPFGATDQFGPDHGLAYPPGPPGLQTNFGFRGVADQGYFLYQPHVRLVDVRYRGAEFLDGKLVRYVDKRGGTLLLSAEADAALSHAANQPARKIAASAPVRTTVTHHRAHHVKHVHRRWKVHRVHHRHVDPSNAPR